ncbi:MAG: ABC transporter permease [Prevotella sp.]
MKQFSSFIHKEFLHIFRDSRTMLILLVMPLVLICLFGFAISTEVKDTRVFFIDQTNTQQSRALQERIGANPYFTLTDNRIDADVTVIIDKDDNVQLLIDGSEPNQAQTRLGYITQLMSGKDGNVNIRMLFNPQMKSEYNFVPGIIGMIILLICAMMTSISIVREKENGTMEILLASPLNPFVIITSKLIPYFIVSCVNIASVLLLSKYAFGLPIGEVGVGWTSIFSFFALSMVYILVALALGLLISCVVSSQLAAMLLSLLLIVPTMYLSGLAFPIESMPEAFQNVSCIVPARWFMNAVRRILIQGVEFADVAKEFGILCLQAALLIILSVKLFKTRLE